MKKVMAKAALGAGAALMLAQPALAQSYEPRPYSEVEAEQQAYGDGYADEATRRAYEQGREDARRELEMNRQPDYAEAPAGYCYQRKANARTTGTILGAIAGGLIGNSVSHRWDRGGNTIGGAMLGGMLGRSLGDDSVQCYQNAWYSYEDGYYNPPPPPRGHVTVFFSSRPSYGHYHVHRRHHRHW